SSAGISGKTAAPSGTSPGVCSSFISTSSHRRDDRQLVAVLDRGVQIVEVADVLVVEVKVDEPPNLAVLHDALRDGRELLAKRVEHSLHGAAADFDDGLAFGVLAERGWYLDADGHWDSFDE